MSSYFAIITKKYIVAFVLVNGNYGCFPSMIYYTGMSSDEEDIPDLVPATSKVPITIITGFLGRYAICVCVVGGTKVCF